MSNIVTLPRDFDDLQIDPDTVFITLLKISVGTSMSLVIRVTIALAITALPFSAKALFQSGFLFCAIHETDEATSNIADSLIALSLEDFQTGKLQDDSANERVRVADFLDTSPDIFSPAGSGLGDPGNETDFSLGDLSDLSSISATDSNTSE